MSTWKIVTLVWALSVPLISACNTSEPTSAVLSNQYPSASSADSSDATPVYKGWWAVAQFPDPVAAGETSDPVRVVLGSDYGYALLAPGWDSTSGSPPSTLIPVRSAQKLSVARGELLTFVVSEQATIGDCRADNPLTQEDADFVTQRIFPGQFAGLAYDAASCTSVAVDDDDGDGGSGGESGSPESG
jgi:hypothetical protein